MQIYYFKKYCLIPLLLAPSILIAENTAAAKQPAIELTLHDAIFLALRHNPNILQSEIQRVADKYALIVAKNQFELQYQLTGNATYTHSILNDQETKTGSYGLSPTVSLESHYGTQMQVAADNAYANGHYTPGVTFSVTQPLIQGFGRPVVDAALNNAKDSELINQMNFKQTAISTVAQVINDYLSWIQSYQQIGVDKQSLQNYQLTVKNDQSLIKAGRMARADIVQAQAQVASQEATIQADLNNINSAKNQLLDDLGLPPQLNIIAPKNFNFAATEKEILGSSALPAQQDSEKIGLDNNLELKTANITLRTLQRSLLVAEDQRRWSVNLVASEQRTGVPGTNQQNSINNLIGDNNHTEQVGLALTIPIDDVSAQANVVDQKVALEKAQIALQEAKRQLAENIDTQYQSVITSKQGLALSENALALQKQTVHISQQKQIAGRASTFEVLSNQKDLAEQQESLVSSQIAYLKSIVSLQSTLGTTLDPWQIHIKY